MDCEFYVDTPDIKQIEVDYFKNLEFLDSIMFGGTMGQSPGGITEMATTTNQKLFAAAIDNGTILIYDTEFWQLIRLFEGDPAHKYIYLEFSHDNSSQLLTVSNKGVVQMFLLKGYNPPDNLSSKYIDPKQILMYEDYPLILIPYYNLNFSHFLTEQSAQIEGISREL